MPKYNKSYRLMDTGTTICFSIAGCFVLAVFTLILIIINHLSESYKTYQRIRPVGF